MASRQETPKRWTLVTGATSGLGYEIALELAAKGNTNLVITGRRADALSALAEQVTGQNVEVQTVEADLSVHSGVEAVLDVLKPLALEAAILNAGVTQIGAFEDHSWPDYQRMIDLNVSCVTALSYALMPALKGQSGTLMLVASLGGLGALPYQAVYAGTKAYLANFGLSLAAEAQTAPARVVVFAPGGIATQMTRKPEFEGQKAHLMPADEAARQAIQALGGGNTLVIPGWQNKGLAAALKFLPRRWTTAVTQRSFRKSIARAQNKA